MAKYDLNVARQAYHTAKELGASDKVMLALFEAGIVESGMRNLNHGHLDSLGFLQQRPSQGWGSAQQVQNVPYATTQFVTRAMRIQNKYATSGQLAQAVQRSAYPLKYDAAALEASRLLTQVKGSPGELPDPTQQANTGRLEGIARLVKLLTDPKTYLRIAMVSVGATLIMIALVRMGWQGAPEGVKKVAKTVAKVAVTKKVK